MEEKTKMSEQPKKQAKRVISFTVAKRIFTTQGIKLTGAVATVLDDFLTAKIIEVAKDPIIQK